MQIKKYALAALACAAMSVPVLNQASVAADNSAEAGSFYFKLKGGYNNAAKRKISYSGVPGGSGSGGGSTPNSPISLTVDTTTTPGTAVIKQGTATLAQIAAGLKANDASGNGAAVTNLDTGATSAIISSTLTSHVLGANASELQLSSTDGSGYNTITLAFAQSATQSDGTTALTNNAFDVTVPSSGSGSSGSSSQAKSITDEEFDAMTGVAISGAVGYRLSDAVRAEASYTYAGSNMKHRDTNNIETELKGQNHEFMVSSYYDLKIDGGATPFVGVGVGYSVGNTSLAGFDNTSAGGTAKSLDKDVKFKADSGFMGKLEAGLQFPICEGVTLEGSYALKATSSSTPKDATDKALKSTPTFLDKDAVAIASGDSIYSAKIEKGEVKSLSHELSAGISVNF